MILGVSCKITSFRETEDGRYLIELKGVNSISTIQEINTENKYRVLEVDFKNFYHDLNEEKEKLEFSDLELILKI